MKNILKKTAILAVIGAALALQGAQAQIVVNNGDLIFGAETVNGGVAAGNDVEVDLGSITKFSTTASLSFGNVSSTDLSSVLGSGYSSASNTFWSVAGTTNTSDVGGFFKGSVFATLANNPGAGSKTTLNPASSAITSTYAGLTQSTGFTAGSNSSTGILSVSSGTSYSATEGTAAGATTFFGFSGGGSSSFGSGLTLNLYALGTAGDLTTQRNTVGTDVLLGTFSYSASTGLTFTGAQAQAVPEPSAYVLAFLAVGVFAILKRRHALKS